MSMFDNVATDERLRCEKCGGIIDCQTKGALGDFQTLTINQLAGFMALYSEGEGLLLHGYCNDCRHMTYFELKPVTVERVDDPFERAKNLINKIGRKGRIIVMDEASSGDSKDKSVDGGAR